MKKILGLSILFVLSFYSCSNKVNESFKVEALSPWCIRGFDSLDRSPEQRIAMLRQMGFTKYGYNKGKGQVDEMKEEFKRAKENNIEIVSIFLWLNKERDSIGKLSPSNQELLKNLGETTNKPTIWVSFSNNFFEDLNQDQAVEFSIEMLKFIKINADEVGCKLAIYNHRGWFGNPHNQLEILEKLNYKDLTMVYNFHHAHEFVDEFQTIAKKIKPYLSYVNLNGVKKGGPEILAIGQGDHELEMIKILINEGYYGPWGILGHVKTEDVQKVLKRNLDGLNLLVSKLK